MDETTRNDIRNIFLSPRQSCALMTAALLFGMTLKELKKEIEDGAIRCPTRFETATIAPSSISFFSSFNVIPNSNAAVMRAQD